MSPNERGSQSRPSRRMTWQKQAIMENVLSRCDHPTAQEVHRDLDDRGIGLATVYRNLAFLAAEGIVSTVEHHGEVRYDCNNQPHGHATCTACGLLWDIPLPKTLNTSSHQTEPLASADRVDYTLRGTCSACQ